MNDFKEIENFDHFYLWAWNGNTKDWIENRKYIAVLKKHGCHMIQSKKGEGVDQPQIEHTKEKQLVFSFTDFIGVDTKTTGDTFLAFERNDRQFFLKLEDCTFYKCDKPPILNKIENNFKQNQI